MDGNGSRGMENSWKWIVGIVVLLVIIVIAVVMSTVVAHVGVGEVSVMKNQMTGGIRTFSDGSAARWYSKVPWETVTNVYIAISEIHMYTTEKTGETGEFPAISALTSDGLSVTVDLTVRWKIRADKVLELYMEYPKLNWKTAILVPKMRDVSRNVLSQYTGNQAYENRTAIGRDIQTELEESVSTDPSSKGLMIVGVNLRDIKLPTTFINAVEAKMAAEQYAAAAEYNKTKRLIEANATAQSNIIEAEGEAKARKVRAKAMQESMAMIGIEDEESMRVYIYMEELQKVVERGGDRIVLVMSGNTTAPMIYDIGG